MNCLDACFKQLVGKKRVVVGQIVQHIARGDKPHPRLDVAIEILFRIFAFVDVETVRHENPGIHHEIVDIQNVLIFLRNETDLKLQGEFVVYFSL